MARKSRRFSLRFGPGERLKVTYILGGLLALFMVFRLMQLISHPPQKIIEEINRYEQAQGALPREPFRGLIFDCRGEPLVINGSHYRLVAYVDRMRVTEEKREQVIEKLAQVLGWDRGELQRCMAKYRLNEKGTPEPNYYCVLEGEVDRIRKKELEARLKEVLSEKGKQGEGGLPDWLGFEAFPIRYHPEGRLASHILGTYLPLGGIPLGIESSYNDYLTGKMKPSRAWAIGESGLPISSLADGCSLILTIDREIQRAAEEILEKTVLNHNADGGTIIVVDTATGGILAMANYPDFDPDAITEVTQQVLRNPAISEVYEPGSVFKLVTYAAALDSGLITPESPFYDEGHIFVGGHEIRNFGEVAYGDVTAVRALVFSINVVATKINLLMGADVFYSYVRRFGFDAKTGIDLPGEANPLVKFPGDSKWSPSDLGTNSFGQGISVTPLHMAMAIAAIANKGLLMKPHVVSEIICDGQAYRVPPEAFRVRQVISPQSAETLTKMMVEVVDYWHNQAGVPGYSAAGKTGTAQIPIGGSYQNQEVIASFGGFVPASDPKVAILVKINRPKIAITGLEVAAPAFKELAIRILPLLGVPPDRPGELAKGG